MKKQKSYLSVLAIIFAVIISAWILLRITGLLNIYKAPSAANEPSIKAGSRFLVTNNRAPHKGDFITFKNEVMDSLTGEFEEVKKKGKQFIYRYCATQGDVVKMINGVLFVNNVNADEKLNLCFPYTCTLEDFNKLDIDKTEYENEPYKQKFQPINEKQVLVTLTTQEYKKYSPGTSLTPNIENPSTDYRSSPFWWNKKNEVWSLDNFGPLAVPAGYCFVLGDNRHQAMDSRFFGFVELKKITGVKL